MCIDANCFLNPDVENAICRGYEKETNTVAKDVLNNIIKNAEIARDEAVPICQDTGMAVVFLKIGQDVHISGGLLCDAVNEGVRRG